MHWKHVAGGALTLTMVLLIVSDFSPKVTSGAIFGDVDTGTFVKATYYYLLDRDVDEVGLPYWKNLIDKKQLSRKDFVFSIYRSFEYQSKNKIDSLSNQQFVAFLYNDFLKRNGAQFEINSWINHLTAGRTRAEVAKGFVISPEFEKRFSDFLTQYAVKADCRLIMPGSVFTGTNNQVGLSSGDQRFLCVNNKFYECGWEMSDSSLAVKAANGQIVGNWKCDLANKNWANMQVGVCTDANWKSALSPLTCPSMGKQTKTWSKIGQCSGGVGHPASEIITCIYQAPKCASYTYSAWGACQPTGVRTRTVAGKTPTDCVGTPILSESCAYIPLCTEADWLAKDGPCRPKGKLTKTWTKIGNCEGGVSKTASEEVSCVFSNVIVCNELSSFSGTTNDASATIKSCIDKTPVSGVLKLPAGKYYVGKQINITKSMKLKTDGKREGDAKCQISDAGCAEIIALPSFTDQGGILISNSSVSGLFIDHIIINGNKESRAKSQAAAGCRSNKNQYGFNIHLICSNCKVTNSVSKNALCGTALGIGQGTKTITLFRNTIAYNGVHNTLWADGITAGDLSDSVFIENELIDNTDVAFIFGGCRNCKIQNNIIKHTDRFEGSSYAALMIHAWPPTGGVGGSSGNYAGTDISGNKIDCGNSKRCGFGLYIGSDAWYSTDSYGGSAHDNEIKNAQIGLNVDHALNFEIYNNRVINSGGIFNTDDCGLKTSGPYNISPDSKNIDRTKDKVPADAYSAVNWDGCIPNWWTIAYPTTAACTNECSVLGASECLAGGGYRNCGNYDTDKCLEWSPKQHCFTNEKCSSGVCVPL